MNSIDIAVRALAPHPPPPEPLEVARVRSLLRSALGECPACDESEADDPPDAPTTAELQRWLEGDDFAGASGAWPGHMDPAWRLPEAVQKALVDFGDSERAACCGDPCRKDIPEDARERLARAIFDALREATAAIQPTSS